MQITQFFDEDQTLKKVFIIWLRYFCLNLGEDHKRKKVLRRFVVLFCGQFQVMTK